MIRPVSSGIPPARDWMIVSTLGFVGSAVNKMPEYEFKNLKFRVVKPGIYEVRWEDKGVHEIARRAKNVPWCNGLGKFPQTIQDKLNSELAMWRLWNE